MLSCYFYGERAGSRLSIRRSSPTCQKVSSSVNANRKVRIAVRLGKIELKSL
jgi:hypothetical protein